MALCTVRPACYGVEVDARPPSAWTRPETVAGFAQAPPNATLMAFADDELGRRGGRARALDVGCGAGRNAVPLARQGWDVIGIDQSEPMLRAALGRAREDHLAGRLRLACARMEAIPIRDRSVDLAVAHGIWNLARSGAEFRLAIREAGRVLTIDAPVFLFTFSRNTLPAATQPVAGEPFVFTSFSGEPQCFLTEEQLVTEMAAAGFTVDPRMPLQEHNQARPGLLPSAGVPVLYEGVFRYRR